MNSNLAYKFNFSARNSHLPVDLFSGLDDFLYKMLLLDKKKTLASDYQQILNEKRKRFNKIHRNLKGKETLSFKMFIAVIIRFIDLMILSIEDNIEFSLVSRNDAMDFFILDNIKNPAIFLHDDGNFRLMWKNGEEQAAFKFLGHNKIRYVIFAKRNGFIARSSGEDSLDNLIPLVKLNHLEKMVFA
jgi:hypothetical protein